MSSPASPLARRLPWLLVLVLLGAGGYLLWHFFSQPDMEKVFAANLRGVGHMEHFKGQEGLTGYVEGVAAFEEVVRLAPDWIPGRINLGIALINLARGITENGEREAILARAIEHYRFVLGKEPDNPYAHFGLGIINMQGLSRYEEARVNFRRVTELDPNDPIAWHCLGITFVDEPEEALRCFRKAVELDPVLHSALYKLQENLRLLGKDDEARALLDTSEALNKAEWSNTFNDKYYNDIGKYAQVIGRIPGSPPLKTAVLPSFQKSQSLKIILRKDVEWAGTPGGELGEIRRRFGATLVVLDYNRDDRPDLFLVGAVRQGGEPGDLLLRNDDLNRYTDVTEEAGLAGKRRGVGCTVADFDNDGFSDLLLTTLEGVRLFRNTTKGGFEDVTDVSGLGALRVPCLGATFVDLDQDGDLDLLIATHDKGGVVLFLNVGEAPVNNPNVDPPPLKPAFRRHEEFAPFGSAAGPAVAIVVSDLDQDQDLDLVLLPDNGAPVLVRNDRLLRFEKSPLSGMVAPWCGGLVLDVNRDERSDLLLIGGIQPTPLLVRGSGFAGKILDKWFDSHALMSPPLLQAQSVDLDLDGAADIVALVRENGLAPRFLHNEGGRLVPTELMGLTPQDTIIGLTCTDANGDGAPDLWLLTEKEGLTLFENKGNGHRALKIALSGHRRVEKTGFLVRTNADGYGTRVIAQSGSFLSFIENTTLSAGLGQSSQPLTLGLGRHPEAELVRLRWPDLCWQAEFHVPGVNPMDRTFGAMKLEQKNRKETSCPVLFAWNGERFVFVNDFLGAGTVGESLPGGGHRPPRPEESLKIESDQLAPRDGRYVLKFAEPMDEVTYLDHLKLVVLDHPEDVRVYPDERFHTGGPPPTQELLAFRKTIFPERAKNHRGRDLTDVLRRWDRETASEFRRRTWIGIAEEHAVELDFGNQLAGFDPKDRLILCLAGWTDYPYPDSIWAATQAGVPVDAPVLERRRADGTWEKLADAGFPAGLPRMMTREVTGLLGGGPCVLRLRTNMHVFWDQIFVAPLLEIVGTQKLGVVKAVELPVTDAALSWRGIMREFSPDGRLPTLYDYDRLDTLPAARLAGRLTRFGGVTELLQATDDRFVLFGPGDELSVHFDARSLPTLPTGWRRSFVLRTWGYCKDCAPFTATGDTVEPLPFRAMSRFPYGKEEKHPDEAYQRQWNTRQVRPRR